MAKKTTTPERWSIPQVMQYTGLTRSHLAQMRFQGYGPKFHKPTPHKVIYDAEEVKRWWASTQRQSTAEV